MSSSVIVKFVAPWKYKREQKLRRLNALRQRDGDNCRRCKRPLRFDFPGGHDQAPKIEHVLHSVNGGTSELDNLCLTHVRCNAGMVDHTTEVVERVRRKSEAELFSKSRRRKRKAA